MKYLVIDGNNLAHISFHRAKSILSKKVKFSSSELSGMMILIFVRKLNALYKNFKDYYFIIAWDNRSSSNWRKEIFSGYKSHRKYNDDPTWKVLFETMDNLKTNLLNNYPIYQIQIENLEADDVIYHLATTIKDRLIIVSTDSDLIQIVQNFKNVKLFNPLKTKYTNAPKEYDYVIYKSFKGDKSDDINGIPRVGDKTAQKYAIRYNEGETIENILENNEEYINIFYRNKKLIDISNNPYLKNLKIELPKEVQSNLNLNNIKKFLFDNKVLSIIEHFEEVMNIWSKKN